MFNYVVSSVDVRVVLYGMGDNYVCQESSRYSAGLWDVHDNIRNKLLRTNKAVEGYYYRMSTIFPRHPHIYEFVRRWKDQHEFQLSSAVV
jgi:hypothetical protein